MPDCVVVAGGSAGIGRSIVDRLVTAGRQVVVYSRHAPEDAFPAGVIHHAADFVEDNPTLRELPGEIQGCVYCPGSINLKSFRSLTLDDFREDLEVNLLGAVKFLQACLPSLKSNSENEPSSVVLFSTVAVAQGMSMHSSIASAKGAVEGLTRSLAAEWAPRIRVNCLAPALTKTRLSAKFFARESAEATLAGKYPLKRVGLPDDLAAAAEFLLSSASGWLTGQVLGVDGGMAALSS